MYGALRFCSLLLKITAIVCGLMGLFVFFVVQIFASFVYSAVLAVFNPPPIDPTLFVSVCTYFVTFIWFVGCIGIYAAGQYIDAFLSIEKNVRALAGHKLYAGDQETSRRNLWEER
ncbi:MAG: hypothetical protein IT320_10120 [Anaerolineae bacterium]|nr:hypothetical protein [Anaerolineae bacterium]